jgi:UDPglucose 6-dehydrogenase
LNKEEDRESNRQSKSNFSAAPLSGPMGGLDICVIGGGFVGLVVAAGFAQFGHKVICVEKDRDKLSQLKAGVVPFYERDLEDLIRLNLQCDRLSFAGEIDEALDGQKAIFIAVGTPSSAQGRANLEALEESVETLSQGLSSGQIIVLKSTIPIGSSRRVQAILSQNSCKDKMIAIINSPEFLREGTAVYDFFHPQRIVIGGQSSEAIETVKHIYRLGMTNPVPIVVTNNETAEMIKYASNAFLATKVGFINELAGLCDHVGVNIMEVAHAMGLDPRIGPDFLNPGPGWGGSCLPKDISEFLGLAESHDFPLVITKAVSDANVRQFELVVSKVKRLSGELQDKRIGVLGLTFKAETSDMRGSPAIPIITKLLQEGATIKAFDPAAGSEAGCILPKIEIAASANEVADDADCILILTEWSEFQLLDWQSLKKKMRQCNIVDARNILLPEQVRRYGFNYLSMGQI